MDKLVSRFRGSAGPCWNGAIGSAMRYDLFRRLSPGDVIIVDTGGHRVSGPWGRNTSLSAKAAGAAGIVIDGGTRDALDLLEMALPTFVWFTTPVLAHGRWQIDELYVPIRLAGQAGEAVRVHPGDLTGAGPAAGR